MGKWMSKTKELPKQIALPQRCSTKLSPHARGARWERNVYLGIAEYLSRRSTGYVHHLVQRILHGYIREPQIVDILVDNINGYYFGIECKSKFSGDKGLYVTSWFGNSAKQFYEEEKFFVRSNRIGIVALLIGSAVPDEDRMQYCAYLIPFSVCKSVLLEQKTTISLLDDLVAKEFIYRILTTNGVVHFAAEEQIFSKLREMDKRACGLNRTSF